MTLDAATFERFEGRLPHLVSGASSVRSLLQDLRESDDVKALLRELWGAEADDALYARFVNLVSRASDDQFVNESDSALAAYLYVALSSQSTNVARMLDLLESTPRLFWASKVAGWVHSQREARESAGLLWGPTLNEGRTGTRSVTYGIRCGNGSASTKAGPSFRRRYVQVDGTSSGRVGAPATTRTVASTASRALQEAV